MRHCDGRASGRHGRVGIAAALLVALGLPAIARADDPLPPAERDELSPGLRAPYLGLPDPLVARMRAAMTAVDLTTDPLPPAVQTVEPGAILLDNKIHFVPIHLYPVKGGLHDTFAVVIDTQSGLKPIRLEVAGTGIEGGAEGEVRVGKRNLLHGMLLNTPTLLFISAEDTIELFRRTLTGSRVIAATLRPGLQAWNVPQYSIGQAFVQAGARLDTFLDGESRVHFDAFAGPGAIARARPWLGTSRLLEPGVEVLGQITVEK